METDKSM